MKPILLAVALLAGCASVETNECDRVTVSQQDGAGRAPECVIAPRGGFLKP